MAFRAVSLPIRLYYEGRTLAIKRNSESERVPGAQEQRCDGQAPESLEEAVRLAKARGIIHDLYEVEVAARRRNGETILTVVGWSPD